MPLGLVYIAHEGWSKKGNYYYFSSCEKFNIVCINNRNEKCQFFVWGIFDTLVIYTSNTPVQPSQLFVKMDCIFIILDWRGAGWGICVFAVFSKYCKPSLLPSLWGSHTYRCRYCHRLTSGHITPSPSYHLPPPPYHHHSDILCHHHYTTINRLSYTTPTITPSPWHHKPSNQTIVYHDNITITYRHCFLQIWPFSLPSAALGEFPSRCYSSHTLALPTAAACPALRDFARGAE